MTLRIEPVARTSTRIGPSRTDWLASSGNDPHDLAIALETQARSNWCWAAVACAIAAHYGDASWTQEKLAWRILAIDEARRHPIPPPALRESAEYDQQAALERVLRYVNCLAGWSGGRPPFRRLMREIDEHRPLAVAIRWSAGRQHYVLIDGYDRISRSISIADPQTGRTTAAYDGFPLNYRSGGEWMETYWTQKPQSTRRRHKGEFHDE